MLRNKPRSKKGAFRGRAIEMASERLFRAPPILYDFLYRLLVGGRGFINLWVDGAERCGAIVSFIHRATPLLLRTVTTAVVDAHGKRGVEGGRGGRAFFF